MKREKPLAMRRGESVFCAVYLIFALVAGLRFAFAARHGAGELASTLARMTLLLGCGDAFHLVPRILNNLAGAPKSKREENRRTFWLGLGNLVSSITMTIFYVLLFDAMLQLCAASGQAMPTSTGFVKGLSLWGWLLCAWHCACFRRTAGLTAETSSGASFVTYPSWQLVPSRSSTCCFGIANGSWPA